MAIAGQCVSLSHEQKASSLLRCDFWARHDQLTDAIDNARKYGLAHFHSSTVALDPITLSTQALLYASELSLCEASKRKSRDIAVGAGFRSAMLQQRWISAMLGFVDVVNQVKHVDGNKVHKPPNLQPKSLILTVSTDASVHSVGRVRSLAVMHSPASTFSIQITR